MKLPRDVAVGGKFGRVVPGLNSTLVSILGLEPEAGSLRLMRYPSS